MSVVYSTFTPFSLSGPIQFHSKDYLIVSSEMETICETEAKSYQVTMVIKSKRNNEEGDLLSLIQEFPDVTVSGSSKISQYVISASPSDISSSGQAYPAYAFSDSCVL